MVTETDVIICGSGSAGLCAAVWLARYGVRCIILEKRSGPLARGQADGVQCRTVEVFESFGLADQLLNQAYHVIELAFWASDSKGGIVRCKRSPDTPPGLSHLPHLILNQARVNGLLLESMKVTSGQDVKYGYDVTSVKIDEAMAGDFNAYPVTVTTIKDGKEEVFRAKYALGCDGAHSSVRRSLGFKMVGDSSDAVWGVMDVFPQTNFPDIRKKTSLRTNEGSLIIIPREGGSLVRFYIELHHGTVAKDVLLEDLHETARRIFHPFSMDIAETYWWSAYSIGQRLADHFSKDNRVFLTGDACHTHSPKAGQGMNTSLQDGYNIGWKLGAVLNKHVVPEIMNTYTIERQKVAAELIDFDRYFSRLFSSPDVTPEQFSDHFINSGLYTAGLTKKYDDSSITSTKGSMQHLAEKLIVGMRFPSTQVVRFCDAKPIHLVKALPSDGRWRIVVFPGDIRNPAAYRKLEDLGDYLDSANGPIRTFTPATSDIDSYIETIVVLSGQRLEVDQNQIPDYYWPVTGKYRMRDLHKVFFDDESYNSGHGKAYEFYGVDPKQGALVIVRPDQHVSVVAAVDENHKIGNFFSGFSLPRL